MPFGFSPTFILLIPPMILALYAQYKVRHTYSKFSEVPAAAG
ncbi:MAG: zinc metallopeptidase, partial [Candidatus Latescibacteria bacterium]|nr:zinc metallopeptidase [Candidatus Latescibacterota bacterium]